MIFLLIILNSVLILIFIAFFTTFERKVMGSIQRRLGPNVVGAFGLLQSIADGLKLALKETLIVKESASWLFIIAPILTFGLSLMNWAFLPLNEEGSLSNSNIAIILYLSLSSLGVYGIILAGWSSNSKYSFLGCIRSTAQLVSYEVIFAFTIFPLFIYTNGASFLMMPFPVALFLYTSAIIFSIAALAETNRTPFDLPEAEAELVAGYNLEYSSLSFALFFLGEYSSMGSISLLFTLLYLGVPSFLSSFTPFFSKAFLFYQSFGIAFYTVLFCFFFIWVRGTLPRYRYDQLIQLCWVKLLPIILTYIIFISFILILKSSISL